MTVGTLIGCASLCHYQRTNVCSKEALKNSFVWRLLENLVLASFRYFLFRWVLSRRFSSRNHNLHEVRHTGWRDRVFLGLSKSHEGVGQGNSKQTSYQRDKHDVSRALCAPLWRGCWFRHPTYCCFEYNSLKRNVSFADSYCSQWRVQGNQQDFTWTGQTHCWLREAMSICWGRRRGRGSVSRSSTHQSSSENWCSDCVRVSTSSGDFSNMMWLKSWEEAYAFSGVSENRCLIALPSGYWRGLASSANFPGKTLEACLQVLHADIVRIWNIQDDFAVIVHTSSSLLAILTKYFL